MFLKRFTVDEYHRMIDGGMLAREGRHELLDGFIVAKMTHNPAHDLAVSLVLRQLLTRLPQQFFCRVQSAITLTTSEPEPDLGIVIGPERRYTTRHPGASDVALIIEVAESSLADDRNEKGMLYAQAALPQYWIVNLVDHCVEVFTDPTGPTSSPAFKQKCKFDANAVIPLVIDGHDCGQIPVSDLLP